MRSYFLLLALFIGLGTQSQSLQSVSKKGLTEEQKEDWHNLDFEQNKVYGTSTNRVFEELVKDQKPKKKIVVAVIDSGIETDHDDLEESIWTNEDEVPDNGKDDDNNGYVDDVHGWNFLVDETGADITYANMEATRVLRLSKKLKETDGDYPDWLTNDVISRAVEIYNTNVDEYKDMAQIAQFYTRLDSALKSETGKDDYTFDDIIALDAPADPMKSIQGVFKALKKLGITKGDLVEMAETSAKYEDYYLNYDFVTREGFEPGESRYGNNHYEGEHAEHGTHVAGIIAANRENNLGARGIAYGCVEIMVVRAVPDGDENDIDVANAIRYAVDNGANIINMSFGKGLSPYKGLVDAAVQYAADNNVLLVHAAGNDSENNDEVENYPNPSYLTGETATTYLTIGASSPSTKKDLTASFSNYGKSSVDLFAPGYDIYSTVPDNKFKFNSGTSMAAPVVSGVAALVWAYNPDLTAVQLRDILTTSATIPKRKKVLLPGGKKGKEKVPFSELSQTGGIVNAYNAMQLARSTGS